MHDTCIIDCFSVEEIKDAIRKGQKTFRKWCEQAHERYDE
jgi:hypothetical protein